MPTIEQIKAARALLGWSQADLAAAAGLSQTGIARIENGESRPNADTASKILEAFTKSGIEFLDTEGLRRRQVSVLRYQGQDEFRKFMDEVYYAARDTSDDICLFNGMPEEIVSACGHQWYAEIHSKRMKELSPKGKFKIIVKEGEKSLYASAFAEYRLFPEKLFKKRTIYVFGSKISFLTFEDKQEAKVLLIDQQDLADSFRVMFDIAWDQVARKID